MAGGKETPRQKMIGMMYLVLTALLALNVSKQVIAAFITLNDKLDASAENIDHKIESNYSGFDKRRATLKLRGGDTKLVDLWQSKADELKDQSDLAVDYLLRECNAMIEEAEGKDWIKEEETIETKDGEFSVVKELHSLYEIQAYDNYDIPTGMFVGGDPRDPKERGLMIPKKVHEFRDQVCTLMGTYKDGSNDWVFTAPSNEDGLLEALASCNPDDTAKIKQVYESLTYPEMLPAHGEGMDLPWPSVMFDHAPIVAAAAMFTSVKLDIKNTESVVSEFMLSKIDVQPFDFNKIEPLAFARSSYLNQGDSMDLSVMIAAYDSNEVSKIRYGIDADTANPASWKTTEGKIPIHASSPGSHMIKGQIGVKERGELSWKNFSYSYNVGQPMGVVALPEMRVLYWGYDNVVEGTASGFDPNKVTLSGHGCTLRRTSNGKYVAEVSNGTRDASITVSARRDDGSSVNLGRYEFECKPFPPANLYISGKKSGEPVAYQAIRNMNRVVVAMDPSAPIKSATYTILGGEVFVSGVQGSGSINSGGSLDDRAQTIINQSQGKTIAFEVRYRGPDGIIRIANYTGKVR
ncbi:MAG: hypothetical protein HUJ25_10620 [Crocinitomicaceae bacterium]|nr:hypothetical protein [Crocinitomicaceae bacterium]